MADNASDIGAQEHFRNAAVFDASAGEATGSGGHARSGSAGARPAGGYGGASASVWGRGGSGGSRPVVVGEEATSAGWGRGPVPVDPRKYRYDRMRALASPAVQFTATKADRLDAEEAGDVLHSIHCALGIEREDEARLAAFDAALWWQHTINGASVMQDMRGSLSVGGMEFDISDILSVIGTHRLRRFFRAYADEIVEVNRTVVEGYSPYDYVAVEKHGQLMQVAAERGLHKYPELAFDAADACTKISSDARRALAASKAHVIPRLNGTDRPFVRVGDEVRTADGLGE